MKCTIKQANVTKKLFDHIVEAQKYEETMTLILNHEVDATHVPSSELAFALGVDHHQLKEVVDDWEEDADVEDNDYMLNIRLANRVAVRFNHIFADVVFSSSMQWRKGIYEIAKVRRHDMARDELAKWNDR